MEALKQGSDALFILLGGVMVLAMHAGFAFLELGTVRKKNQVNALVKILVDFSVSTVVYFLVGQRLGDHAHDFVLAFAVAVVFKLLCQINGRLAGKMRRVGHLAQPKGAVAN